MKSRGSRGEIIGGTVTLHHESGTSVSPDHTAHGSKFNGKINRVQIDLGKDAKDADHYIDKNERLRMIMARRYTQGESMKRSVPDERLS